MSIHAALHHRTSYHYPRPITHGPHIIRLRPAPHCRTQILSYSLKISTDDLFLNWQQDPFGNYLARCVFNSKIDQLVIDVDLIAKMAVHNPFDFFVEDYADTYPFHYDRTLKRELAPYLKRGRGGQRFLEYIDTISTREMRTIDFVVNLNQRLSQDIKYVIRLKPGVQTPERTLTLGSGSCRDSAWLLVNILRRLGLAARFASGYLIQLKPDVKSLDGPSGSEADFTDLHAWCEVYLPGGGWIGLDPTSGLLAGEGHIPVACTPEPTTAAPITGAIEKCRPKFFHEMSVSRIHETPRVTLPYTDEQWRAIESLGQRVDQQLEAMDVRLTMGGEPTFVSIDDMDGEEWNYTAMSNMKFHLANELLWRLREKMGPKAAVHSGQGKWYPGEPLPRWALSCFWRKDGQPIWRNDDLIARPGRGLKSTASDAHRFITLLARQLQVDPDYALPAFEDAWYYLWRERRLPSNVDPLKSNLKDKQERDRLARLFEQGLDEIIGYALPLHRANQSWESGKWFLRRENLFLYPGDSPMGYRLPLDSLPWVAEKDYPHVNPPDPTQTFADFPAAEELFQRYQALTGGNVTGLPRPRMQKRGPGKEENRIGEDPSKATKLPPANQIVRTALCVEPREGRVHVFMPPLESAHDYLELVAAIEQAAHDSGVPVILEGETPPHDPGLVKLSVTPDPGVIEVNIPPASNWDELVKQTTTVYEEARLTRLGTEKFMRDGRHTGTGGGNHIVLGAETPASSPFLRRPDLLRSLVNYWQNHPSLSFVFSGLFIGPTSQHPRVDEARNDSLYELEIANAQIPDQAALQPWLVDRVFRNLLVDVTGNTHRAEFCIDKLYSPDSASGRLGLLEMRAFEMPPHARMSLTQQLLLRALVSRFWKDPYDQPLVRWQTQIHDRFMLPHFNESDFADVIEDLQAHDLPLQYDWFKPHFEFRFPRYGEINQRSVNLELRQALEPWHVLGEHNAAGGTSRSVDSSLERMQIKVNGLTDSRHVVLCNGRRMPLHSTGTQGEFVAGVRFRAWQPPQCLHPTIGVHSPLTFDLVDTWNERSIGGCTYHVSDPGGTNPDKFPINSFEAESRRLARFESRGHTPGKLAIPPSETNQDLPLTLDLRLPSKAHHS